MIISAFPACGKSFAFEKMKEIDGLKVLDSDSSKFSWAYETERDENGNPLRGIKRIRNPEFPQNYIEHIKGNMNDTNYLFVSSHKVVRDALRKNNIPYVLIYPERYLLDTWVGRCYVRGNNKEFINNLIENWDKWITECEEDKGCTEKIALKYGQYILDVIHDRSR